MNYKSIRTGQVISEFCYLKLSFSKRADFYPVSYEQTHRVVFKEKVSDYDDGVSIVDVMSTAVDYINPFDVTSDSSPDDTGSGNVDFGGGDFGGAGANGDW